ncbi:MAG: hypothetical protein AB8I08_31240 [Sandaracinaceae bacterium]
MRSMLLVSVLLALPSVGWAQPALPDVVHTRDGGMVRGTLVERVPGSHLVIQTATGDLRRIEEVEVVSPPTVTAPPARPAGVPLQLTSDARLGFHLVTGSATATAWGPGGVAHARGYDFRPLCRAPCETALPPGNHRLALARGDDTPIPAASLDITGPATLYGEYTDNVGIRIAGWTTLIVGVAAGLSMMLFPVFDDALLNSDELYVYLGIGGGIAIVAAIIGAPLGFVEDAATIRFD